jgi:hypothetical protein
MLQARCNMGSITAKNVYDKPAAITKAKQIKMGPMR